MPLRAVWFTMLGFSISSCGFDQQEIEKFSKEEAYVIRTWTPKSIAEYVATNDTAFFAGVEYYLDYNIIVIDSLAEVYYHKKRFYCINPERRNKFLPYFRYLQPEYFQSTDHINNILHQVLADTNRPEHIYIAHNQDTITDKRYFRLKRVLNENNIAVATRKLTQEEVEIMYSILNNKEYKPEEIEWTKTSNVPNKDLLIQFKNEL